MRSFDVGEIEARELQDHLQSAIAPRPVALVSTIDKEGNVNLSPFSFFNLFSMNPPVCVFSPSRRVRDNTIKHTLENILEVPECVIHMVTSGMLHQCSLSSTEYPKGVNEFLKSGFTALTADRVRPPRVAESPVQLECEVIKVIPMGEDAGAGNLVLAKIVRLHLQEEIIDGEGRIDQEKLDLVARLGRDWYATIGPENLVRVAKPVTTIGIGIDRLPEYVRGSDVLTGNELAQLANVAELPCSSRTRQWLSGNIGLEYTLETLSTAADRKAYIHKLAKKYIAADSIDDAWCLLTAGEVYEQKPAVKL